MSRCHSCGTTVTGGAQYCPDCGAELSESGVESDAAAIELWYPEEDAILEPAMAVLLAVFLYGFVDSLNVGGNTIGIVVLVFVGLGAISGYQKLVHNTQKTFDSLEEAKSFVEENPPESPNIVTSVALILGGVLLFFYSQGRVTDSLAALLDAVGIGAASAGESGFLGFLFWLFMILVSVGMIVGPLDTLVVQYIREQQANKVRDG